MRLIFVWSSLSVVILTALLAVILWRLGSDGDANASETAGHVFDSIHNDDVGLPSVRFRRLSADEAPGAITEEQFLEVIGPVAELPMREPPRLVEIVGNPFPDTPEADGPLWAFLPDIAPALGGPVPEGVETFVLQLYNARTGQLVLEFGGPIRDGENEWHPDFPEELRYTIEDQIR
jgi:hypothetical protein